MSLRPSARTEVRRNRYKVAVDADEGRRRREDNMVEIRKNRREESLQKKRREVTAGQFTMPAQSASTAEKKVNTSCNTIVSYAIFLSLRSNLVTLLCRVCNFRVSAWLAFSNCIPIVIVRMTFGFCN